MAAIIYEKYVLISYLICLKQILLEKGIPLALYMDRHGIFRRNDEHWSLQEQLAGEQTPTRVGQALRALGIKPIFALSPQARDALRGCLIRCKTV